MKKVRRAAGHLRDMKPYDPKYLPARVYLNASESPYGMPAKAREEFMRMIASEPIHRYPDPLAKELRKAVAINQGLAPECIMLGNGGDELIFNLCLAYGGRNRSLLIAPPTFSSYQTDALLTYTTLIEVPRQLNVTSEGMLDYSVSEEAILECVSSASNDLIMLASPNNPTGECLSLNFINELLAATNAVVLIDQAYIDFSDSKYDATLLLEYHTNLAILRTFSKAYGLAGLRLGYLAANTEIISELGKVRQPYSVNTVSALAGLAVLAEDQEVQRSVKNIISERERLTSLVGPQGLGLPVSQSEANFILIQVPQAAAVWQKLYDEYGILVRDLSAVKGLTDCLRVSIGTPEENDEFVQAFSKILKRS